MSTSNNKFLLVARADAKGKAPSTEHKAVAPLMASRPLAASRQRPGKSGKSRRKAGAPSLPTNINLVSVIPHVGRFSCTSNASQTPVTRGSFASALGAMVTVANTSTIVWASSYRIVKIIIWPAAGSSPILEFPQAGTAEQALQREVMYNETMPTGITLDRPLVWRPPRKSYLSQWQATTSNPTDQLFTLSLAVGTVMDVHSVFTLCSGVGFGIPYGLNTSSTVPLGTIAYFPIDTGNKVQPIGLSTILH